MTSFILKIIACVTMFIDHLSYGIYGTTSWMNYIGRIAFPIFAFQIVEGYTHTKNLKKYFLRLFIFAIVSEIPFYLFHSIISESIGLNVMFTLLLGLFCIWIWEKAPLKVLAVYFIAVACFIAEVSNMDYGYWGVLLVFVFYLCRNNKTAIAFGFLGMLLIKYVPYLIKYNLYYKYLLFFAFTLSAIVPILLYNGKQGKKIKYFLYIFYPTHILLMYGLYHLLH
ncbi:MAG: conjugal transfer protein TraX [Clostridia bacterium]|nr:conjugal transfer protein TraX [Clostridia bacterium]